MREFDRVIEQHSFIRGLGCDPELLVNNVITSPSERAFYHIVREVLGETGFCGIPEDAEGVVTKINIAYNEYKASLMKQLGVEVCHLRILLVIRLKRNNYEQPKEERVNRRNGSCTKRCC